MSYNIYSWYIESFDTPKHYHTKNKNQTLEWSGSDHAKSYKKNLQDPEKYEQLVKYNWLEPIEYRYNSHGFRAEAFDDRPAGIALGCSFTEGTGLHINQTWPSVLSAISNTYIWNLGVGGAAFDTVFRLLDYYLLKFNPQFVCILMPPVDRIEYCDILSDYHVIQAYSTTTHTSFAKEWLTQEINGIQNRRKNILAVKQLCYDANIPVFFEDSMEQFTRPNIDFARDLLHYGPNSQQYIATQFYNQLNTYYGI